MCKYRFRHICTYFTICWACSVCTFLSSFDIPHSSFILTNQLAFYGLSIASPIPQMIHEWIWSSSGLILTGENQRIWRKPVPVPLCPSQIPHGLACAWTHTAAVRSQQLTAWGYGPNTSLYTKNTHKTHSHKKLQLLNTNFLNTLYFILSYYNTYNIAPNTQFVAVVIPTQKQEASTDFLRNRKFIVKGWSYFCKSCSYAALCFS
jgi:hypothetical protein